MISIAASLETSNYSCVNIFDLDKELNIINYRKILENKKVFGLSCDKNKLFAVSGAGSEAGYLHTVNLQDLESQNSFKLKAPIDRRLYNSIFDGIKYLIKYYILKKNIWGDIHDLKYYNNHYFLINSSSDTLSIVNKENTRSHSINLFKRCIESSMQGAIYGRHSLKGNYYHFNSLLIKNDIFYVMCHNTNSPIGSFIITFEIKNNKLKNFKIIKNLKTDVGNFSGKQCHDLVSDNNNIFYLESINKSISYIDNHSLPKIFLKSNHFGYLRGLAINKDFIFVGSSPFRRSTEWVKDKTINLDEKIYNESYIFIINKQTKKVIKKINLKEYNKVKNLEIKNIIGL